MKKAFLSTALAAFAFAGFAKTETPSKAEAKQTVHTYYVVGVSGSNYQLSSTPNDPNGCDELSGSPCEITSTNAMSGTAPKSQVDNQTNGFSIETRQPQLP